MSKTSTGDLQDNLRAAHARLSAARTAHEGARQQMFNTSAAQREAEKAYEAARDALVSHTLKQGGDADA